VPREARIRRYDGRDRPQNPPAQRFSRRCQPPTLVVGETQASPGRLELLLQNAVLFDQVGNHARLATANSASERSQEELQMDGFNHAASASNVRHVVALKCDRVYGHYEIGLSIIILQSYFPSNSRRNLGWVRIGSHIGSMRSTPTDIYDGTDNSVSI